jgi:sigma-B regulation protein RsbU (phosphoserine phosphatase)
MYTDGLTEARDARGEFFGAQRVCDMVRAYRYESGQNLCDRLVQALGEHQDSVPKHDDVTLVAIRAE